VFPLFVEIRRVFVIVNNPITVAKYKISRSANQEKKLSIRKRDVSARQKKKEIILYENNVVGHLTEGKNSVQQKRPVAFCLSFRTSPMGQDVAIAALFERFFCGGVNADLGGGCDFILF
jgi:hypothetical protein